MGTNYTAASYYGGIGSVLLGARWAGFKPDWIYEPRDFFNKETFEHNFPNALDMYNLPDEVGYEPDPPTLMMGSPDCKKFSNLGTKRTDKKDGLLNRMTIKEFEALGYIRFLRAVQTLKPEVFILENVPNILKSIRFAPQDDAPNPKSSNILHTSLLNERGAKTWTGLKLRGYKIQTINLNALDFGVPQSRKRVFVIGALDFQPKFSLDNWSKDIEAIRMRDTYRTGRVVREALAGLTSGIPNQIIPNHSDKRIAGFGKLKPGESYYNTQNNKRLNEDMPAGTIASHCSRFVHPKLPRVLTVRETARIMGFPDTFRFFGSENHQLDQVGKAVVPQVAAALALYIKKQLKAHKS